MESMLMNQASNGLLISKFVQDTRSQQHLTHPPYYCCLKRRMKNLKIVLHITVSLPILLGSSWVEYFFLCFVPERYVPKHFVPPYTVFPSKACPYMYVILPSIPRAPVFTQCSKSFTWQLSCLLYVSVHKMQGFISETKLYRGTKNYSPYKSFSRRKWRPLFVERLLL